MELSEPRALNRAAAYCSKAERCEHDVRRKLKDWGAPEDSISRIIKRLIDEKFISDERFCRSFINDKLRFNKWGKQKIVFELRKRNISESLYSELFDEVPNEQFEEQLMSILITKNRGVKAETNYERKGKLIRFAMGRGFAMDAVMRCVDKIITGGDEEMD